MVTKNAFAWICVFLVLLLAACGADAEETTPEEVSPTATTSAAGQETLTLLDEQGQVVQVAAPRPEFVALMLSQVEAGEISLEEGVIAGLRVLAGEAGPEALFGEQPVEVEGGYGITSLAFQVYQSSSDEAAKAEIARLMDIVAPSQARIDRYAAPEEEAYARPGGAAAPALRRQSVDCASIWAAGFPTDVAEPPVCVLYRSFSAGGYEYRVYYPEARRSDVALMAYVEAAFEALADAREVYAPLSEIRSINLVFTQLPSSIEGSAAEVPGLNESTHGSAPCPISVYPLAMGLPIDEFKQALAHEVFHCLHFFRVGASGFTSGFWYQEGMAEYFSNLVYPTVNFEQRYIEDFSINSNYTWLMDMSYENAVFFQYLGNQFGNTYMIDLVDVLAFTADTKEAQASALAAFGDMQTVFHEFGQAFLLKQIPDTGGGAWPISLYFLEENQFDIGEGRDLFLTTPPFTLQHYILNFEEGREYELNKTSGGVAGQDSWRPPLPDGFSAIPISFGTACGTNPQRVYLLTAASASALSQSEVQLAINSGEAGYFDCCLVGTWEMGTSEIRSMFEAISAAPVADVTGRFVLAISADRTSVFTPLDYSATVVVDERPTTVRVSGVSTGVLMTPEEGVIFSTAGTSSFVETITTTEGSFSFPMEEGFMGPPAGEFGYACTESSLVLRIPAGLAPFSSSTYQRVSDIPATPMPPEDFSDAPEGGADSPGGDIGGPGGFCSQAAVTDFSVAGRTATWSLSNSGDALTLEGMSGTWPAGNGTLQEVALNGATVWSGDRTSPFFVFDDWSVDAAGRRLPEGGGTLSLTFAEAAAAASYGLTLQFSGGCTVLDGR
jgi:hypothetical protein